MVTTTTTNGTRALAELNELRAALVSSRGSVASVVKDLGARKRSAEARERRKTRLQAELTKRKGSRGPRPLVGPGAKPQTSLSVSGLSGLGSWEDGQRSKVNDWANQGYYASMLQAAMRLAFTGREEPEDVLRDDAKRLLVSRVLDASILVEGVRVRAQAALEEMAKSVRGEPSAYPFDAEEYAAALAGDLRYIATHQPNTGFLEKSLRDTGRIVSSLDKWVPGWTVLLDVASPVVPVAAGVKALISALPLVGGAAGAATAATPFLGRQGYAPLSPLQPSYGAPNLVTQGAGASFVGWTPAAGVGPQLVSEQVTTIAGRVSAVKFQLTKSAAQAAQQGAGALEALEKIAVDLLDGYALAAELASFFAAGPELAALQAAIKAMQQAVSLKRALEAQRALERAAARARAVAVEEEREDDRELAALEAALAALKRRLGELAPGGGAASGVGRVAAALALAWLASEVLS